MDCCTFQTVWLMWVCMYFYEWKSLRGASPRLERICRYGLIESLSKPESALDVDEMCCGL